MVTKLGGRRKTIAWICAFILYADFILIPLGTRAETLAVAALPGMYNSNLFRGKPLPRVMNTPVTGNKSKATPLAKKKQPFSTGPSQPEMQSFTSVNNANMVDLFSGDFTYNIPLLDVGGYPVNISYRSGVSMDQEASWVGLGWNINPGTITRNLRGLPDDFNGANDSVKKILSIRENKTIGVTAGADLEIVGLPQKKTSTDTTGFKLGASLGVFHNNYKGWGIELGLNASINAGRAAKGPLSGGLSVTDNSQEGLSIDPSLSVQISKINADHVGTGGSFSIGSPYNSRYGLKGLQLSAGIRQYAWDEKNQKSVNVGGDFSSLISFASPSYTPSITIPFTSRQFSFTGKIGLENKPSHPNFFIGGYVAKQRIDKADTLLALPSYGYMYYQDGARNRGALLDFNREKELAYREKPAVPHIAVPIYTYDAFSITGEGTGGMFRAYRGDVGFIHDHFIRTKDESDRISVDVGVPDLVHAGTDINITRAFTQNGPWLEQNIIKNSIYFRNNSKDTEAVYFRNPAEKAINTKRFYQAVGGDDVVAVQLYQSGPSSSSIQATNYLTRYSNKRAVERISINKDNIIKGERDKRSQVISYLTAREADGGALSKYIENYTPNMFSLSTCSGDSSNQVEGPGTGLPAEYFNTTNFTGPSIKRTDKVIDFLWKKKPNGTTFDLAGLNNDRISIRWNGRIRAPKAGPYTFTTSSDDGVRLWINDSLLINNWTEHGYTKNSATVNLVEGEFYKIKIEYYEGKGKEEFQLEWSYPGKTTHFITAGFMYPPAKDTFKINNYLVKEKRVNTFRKDNHLSEITVLNTDGRRYIYGIPVYNLKQKEATFALAKDRGNINTGLAGYTHNTDNTTSNTNGKDWYFSSEEVPAYAHSFLLTAIVSPDYVDATGNGISDDDLGDAVKFNYSKIKGFGNAYKWRAPYIDSVTYNEGLKTDYRDDKGNYVYGEKELWYLHSIESKTMVATFTVENRQDLLAMDEAGNKINDHSAKRLKEINLYSKSDFLKNPATAKPVKTVHFEYSYELCRGINGSLNDTGKLTLKKIWFSYNGNEKGSRNPYIFTYNSNNPRYNSKSYDSWGNYKNPSDNPGYTSTNKINNSEYPYSLQDSVKAAANAAAWCLDSIFIPSGGALKVKYESDDYAFVQNKRAMQLFKLKGLGTDSTMAAYSNRLHTLPDQTENLYVFVSVPTAVSSKDDVYRKYLSDVQKLYFKLYVKMPKDDYGSGYEYVPCYADMDQRGYGRVSDNIIWIKLIGISLRGDAGGSKSPLAKAAIQFLRLNLPSKAYPGSEVGDNLDLADAVKMMASLKNNIESAFSSFDRSAREKGWARDIDTSRSFVRLNNPVYKKYGGGHRVKRITIYDNWNKMTGQASATYGQDYTYTTKKEINGVQTLISSGVACWEPGIGSDENPFRVPIEYVEKIAPLGPVTMGYSEEPLGESLFPSPNVGYSNVRVRTIHYQNKRSANGYEESSFYTAYDFPVYTDRSLIDIDTKKRYKPALANFLRINARHYLTLSQGFKIELNDMHGKLRSQASYAETDPDEPISYTENIYKVEQAAADKKVLSNVVSAIKPDGTIDSTALIGKDVELMVDMREQLSVTNGYNISLNMEMFTVPAVPPLFVIPSFLNLAQREENLYRSAAILKVVQRYGIIDSIIHIDKGSKVSTKDILYDSETGEALLNRTQNEFNDPVYNFTYPSHWAYDGAGMAYKNINAILKDVTIKEGRFTSGGASLENMFTSGDEILVAGRQKVARGLLCGAFSAFPSYDRIWAIDSSVLNGGEKEIFFIDRYGKPYSGDDVSLKIIRSGRRNIHSAVGTVTSLKDPVKWNADSSRYELVFDSTSQVVSTAAAEMRQFWQVSDHKKKRYEINCYVDSLQDCSGDTSCICKCLKKLFSYLIYSRQLFISANDSIKVSDLVAEANSAGYTLSTGDCHLLEMNSNRYFHALTADSVSNFYQAKIGNCTVSWKATETTNFYHLIAQSCDTSGKVKFYDPYSGSGVDTVRKSYFTDKSMTFYYPIVPLGELSLPGFYETVHVDTSTRKIISGYYTVPPAPDGYPPYDALELYSFVKFKGIDDLPPAVSIQSANLYLYAHRAGLSAPRYPNAHFLFEYEVDPMVTLGIGVPSFDWNYSTSFSTLRSGTNSSAYEYMPTEPFQDYVLDAMPFIENWRDSGNRGLRFYPIKGTWNFIYSTFVSNNTLNHTKEPRIDVIYTVPKDTIFAELQVEYCQTCDTIITTSCQSTVIDTSFNPYTTGLLGNWRTNRSYTYYNTRLEKDPQSATNIRLNGTIENFQPFWAFEDGKLTAQYDTTRWVWNSEITRFNNKGFEIENRDPLGRYNAGLYGYNLSLPTAVIQNARNRESAFEGFEDYGFATQVCDTSCPTGRHFDFSGYRSKIDTTYKHSGRSSLKLDGGEEAGISVNLTTAAIDTAMSLPVFTLKSASCPVMQVLKDIKMSNVNLLPLFSPLKGKRMLLSAWVKEDRDCSCSSYTDNRITIAFSGGGGGTLHFTPSGNIIEGWQRYEAVFDIPNDATSMVVNLEATGETAVYFDDLRIHPFNANMKSFVFNPGNLRLMAELDENNHATFYEYDDDGTLIRVKKETERGIKTIKESRSALTKQ